MKRIIIPEPQNESILYPKDVADDMIVIAKINGELYKLSGHYDVTGQILKNYVWAKLNDCRNLWTFPISTRQEAIKKVLEDEKYCEAIYVFEHLHEFAEWILAGNL